MIYAFNLEFTLQSGACHAPPGCESACANAWATGKDREDAKIKVLEFFNHAGWTLSSIEIEGESISVQQMRSMPNSTRPADDVIDHIEMAGIGCETFYSMPDTD